MIKTNPRISYNLSIVWTAENTIKDHEFGIQIPKLFTQIYFCTLNFELTVSKKISSPSKIHSVDEDWYGDSDYNELQFIHDKYHSSWINVNRIEQSCYRIV